jgi:hypothetical protein
VLGVANGGVASGSGDGTGAAPGSGSARVEVVAAGFACAGVPGVSAVGVVGFGGDVVAGVAPSGGQAAPVAPSPPTVAPLPSRPGDIPVEIPPTDELSPPGLA